jgi:hypothetical protein
MLAEHSLNLSQLDAKSSQLHLIVYTPKVFNLPAAQSTRQVARPIQSCACDTTERIGYESFGR